MSRKIIVFVVSLILVVGVTNGIVVTVNKKDNDPHIQSSQKYLGIICQNTHEQKLCHETLKSVKGLDSADPKAYIVEAVKATMDSVIKALNMSDRLISDHTNNDSGVNTVLKICNDSLQYCMYSLKKLIDMLQNNNIQQVHNYESDFTMMLAAIIGYENSCIDSFDNSRYEEKKTRKQFQTQSLDRVEKLASITLDIVADLSHILEKFGLKLNLDPVTAPLVTTFDGKFVF